jgi:hypothetical protein
MTGILGASIAQTTSVSVTKSVEIQHEQRAAALSASAYLGRGREVSGDQFSKVFDVVDISEDAQRKLREDREFALELASLVQGRNAVKTDEPLYKRGSLRVDVGAIAAQESFSFTESYELSFLQETTVTLETTDGNVEITQSRLIEASFSSSVAFERSAIAAYAKGSLTG